jgi:hypothetical protein
MTPLPPPTPKPQSSWLRPWVVVALALIAALTVLTAVAILADDDYTIGTEQT